MKHLYLIVACLFVASAAFSQSSVPKEELEKMDFWVGEWNLTWEGGKGSNRIEKTLDGKVIQENFEGLEGQYAGFKGTSISVFNPQTKMWHQAWADNNGGYINFISDMEGENRIFQTIPREGPNGQTIVSRMRFYDITGDSFTWDWERSTDGGETWSLNWRIFYERK